MPSAVDSSALVSVVRAVLAYARASGMPSELEAQIAGDVVDALLELQGRRRADHRPQPDVLAERIARARGR